MKLWNFNPRSHEGSDRVAMTENEAIEISIHAPTRGATWVSLVPISFLLFQSTLPRGERRYMNSLRQRSKEFQSTLPRGERRIIPYDPLDGNTFQSTLPRGERLLPSTISMMTLNFNPRSHEGSDTAHQSLLSFLGRISIHAPTRGATSCARSRASPNG